MKYILDHKRIFISIEILSIIFFAICLYSLRSIGEATLYTWQATGLLTSVIIFGIGFFPLCYVSWFNKETTKALFYLKQAFYWSFAMAFIVIIFGISTIYVENT